MQAELEGARESPPATLPAIRQLLERLEDGGHAPRSRDRIASRPAAGRARWPDNAGPRWRILRLLAPDAVRRDPHACAKWRRCRGTLPQAVHARARMAAIESLAVQAAEFAQMEYDFLFDRARHLLTIGYNVAEHRADQSYYDLLASEARLCSFVAIAQGHLPQDNWFAMGRLLVTAGGEPMLLSWSGSMFEYLMPLVVMPTYENTLLDQTYKAAVARQIEYGAQRGVPWGVSESGYNAVDAQLNYQYRAFGVPGTGLKRGLADDLVIAPYASALALMVAPEEACINLEKLSQRRLRGDIRFIRSHRLHAFARAPGTTLRRGPLLHGASPGHEPALVRPSAAGPPDAEAVRGRTRCSRRPRCCLQERVPRAMATLFAPGGGLPTCALPPRAGKRRCASSANPIRRRPNCSSCRTAATT